MKDLRPRWNPLVVLLVVLGTMAGSTELQARTQFHPVGNSLVASVSPMNFGTVDVGDSATQANFISNPTSTSITIGKAITSGSYFQLASPSLPVTIQPGQSTKFVFSFVPNRAGNLQGSIAIWASAGQGSSGTGANSENLTLMIPAAGVGSQSGTGPLVASASTINFGATAVGSSSQQSIYISNPSTAYVSIGKTITSGSYYRLVSPALPAVIPPGGGARFVFSFSPNREGSLPGTISFWSSTGSSDSSAERGTESLSLVVAVAGTGGTSTSSGGGSSLGKLSVNPLAFGIVPVGKTQTQSATITNSGGASVTVSEATVSGTGFTVSAMNMPMKLSPNQSATVNITCAPKSAGALSGSLNISSDASDPSVAVALSATAVATGDLVASAPTLSFGSVQVGKTQSLPETLTNSGGTTITLSQAAAGAGFSVTGLSLPLTLAAGSSTSFNIVFAPQATGNSSVNLAIINDGPTPTLTIPLSGAGQASGALTASSVSFGSVQVGNSSTKQAVLTNSGGTSVTVSQATLMGTGFAMDGLSTPMTLGVGQSFTFNVTFTPQSAGAASGSIALVSTASDATPSIALSGTGTSSGQFSVSPGSFAFGSITVGTSKSLPVTLSASGSSVTVTSASVSSAEFALSGPALPFTIPAGSTASFSLTFAPQSSGAATASVSFATSASATPVSEPVSGSGTAAPQHSVDLSWTASASTVTSYNVYRGSVSGGPYAMLNSTSQGTLTYTDTSVEAGQTYFYTTTAVASDGTESAHSNEVKAVIPTP